MKKITALLILAFIIISACMIYLIRSGVSIRSAALIRPSVISTDGRNMSNGLVIRLAQQLKNTHYIVWGFSSDSDLFDQAQEEFEKLFPHLKVSRLQLGPQTTAEEIRACPAPCWIVTEPEKAHELAGQTPLPHRSEIAEKSYFNLSVIHFSNAEPVTAECDSQKRLNYACIKTLSVREAQRKMKKPNERYFFLRQYLEKDYFLFVQSPH